jgi:hypothetical protein
MTKAPLMTASTATTREALKKCYKFRFLRRFQLLIKSLYCLITDTTSGKHYVGKASVGKLVFGSAGVVMSKTVLAEMKN